MIASKNVYANEELVMDGIGDSNPNGVGHVTRVKPQIYIFSAVFPRERCLGLGLGNF